MIRRQAIALVALLVCALSGAGVLVASAGAASSSPAAATPVRVSLAKIQHSGKVNLANGLPARHPGGQTKLDQQRAEARSQAPSRGIQTLGPAGSTPSATQTPSAGTGFNGISSAESFCGCYPPDGAVAVGPSDVVGAVNTAFKVWNTSGSVLVSATSLGSLFASQPACKANISDPGVQYDPAAGGHYIIEALTYDNAYNSTICFAVSVSNNPTGSYWIYGFPVSPANDLLDFPQFAIGSGATVGPDAIYLSGNQFQNGATFAGARVYAFNKVQMEAGQAAQSVYRNVGNDAAGYAADTLYPAKGVTNGAAYFVAPDNNFSSGSTISVWKWSDPFGANSFALQGGVNVTTYTQPPKATEPGGTTDTGDTRDLGAAYYNGTVYGVHTTGCAPSGGATVPCVQWYQLGNVDGTPSLIQQGIFGSAGKSYYYPNLAVDKAGDMLMGYAYASSTDYPGVHYTGRLASDAAGTLQSEAVLKTGEAYINGSRYGDYAGIQLAPDGCTVWHLEEYAQSGQTWGTWVGNMSFPGCSSPTTAPAPPTNLTATAGDAQVSLSWMGSSGASSYNVKRSTTLGGPYTTVASGVSATSYVDSGLANGTTYYYVVSAQNSSGESANSSQASATPTAPPPDFSLSASPTSSTMGRYGSTRYQVSVVPANGYSASVTMSVSGLPAGVTSSWAGNPAAPGAPATLTLSGSGANRGTYTLTISGTDGTRTHSTTVTLTITKH